MERIFFSVIFLFFLTFVIFSKDPDKKKIDTRTLIAKNLKVSVWENGGMFNLFFLNRVEDKDVWVPLFFFDRFPTNYIRIYKDGENINFGSGGKEYKQSITIKGESVIYNWESKDFLIDLVYYFEKINSNNFDTLIMKLIISNKREYDYNLKILYCFDTYLNETGDKFFSLPGDVSINEETEIKNLAIPSYVSTNVTGYDRQLVFLLDRQNFIRPSRIFFANWKKVNDSIESYKVKEGANFDSGRLSVRDSAFFIDYQDLVLRQGEKLENSIYINVISTKSTKINVKPVDEKGNEKDNVKDDKDRSNLENMDLSELFKLLDEINKKLESGNISKEDLDRMDRILKEIEKRRNK